MATSKNLTTPNTGVCSRCGGLFDSAGAVRTRVCGLGGCFTHFTHARRCPSLILPHHGVNDSTRAGTHCRSRQSLSRGETLSPARLDIYSQDTRFAPPRCCCSLATRSNHAYDIYICLLNQRKGLSRLIQDFFDDLFQREELPANPYPDLVRRLRIAEDANGKWRGGSASTALSFIS